MICNEILKTYNMGVYWSISFQIIGAACLVNASFHIDRPPPEIPFQQHFCGKYYMYHILIAAIYRNDLYVCNLSHKWSAWDSWFHHFTSSYSYDTHSILFMSRKFQLLYRTAGFRCMMSGYFEISTVILTCLLVCFLNTLSYTGQVDLLDFFLSCVLKKYCFIAGQVKILIRFVLYFCADVKTNGLTILD